MQRSIALATLSLGFASFLPAQTQAGIESVEVVTSTATVEKLDLQKLKATLRLEDGKSKTVKVDKSVQNFDQVKVGDKIKFGYAEGIIMTIAKGGKPAAAGGGVVALAPQGAKPGTYAVETEAMTAKVVSTDAAKHKVVLEEPDGKKSTVKVSKKVQNLDQLKPGDTVNVEITQALVLEVVK
jgi:translation initiation factor IF-1